MNLLRDKIKELKVEQKYLVELDTLFEYNIRESEKEINETVQSLVPQYLGSAHILNMLTSGCKCRDWIPKIHICSVQEHIKLDNGKWVKKDHTKFSIISQKVLYESDFKGMIMADIKCNLYQFMTRVKADTGLECTIEEIQYCEGVRPLMGISNAYQLECSEDVKVIDKDSIEYKGTELSDDYYLAKDKDNRINIYVGEFSGIDYKICAFDYIGLEAFLAKFDEEAQETLRNIILESWDNKL